MRVVAMFSVNWEAIGACGGTIGYRRGSIHDMKAKMLPAGFPARSGRGGGAYFST